MSRTWIIFTHELRILLGDRQALGLLFVMPLVFILFLTLALQDVYLMKVSTGLKLDVISQEECTKPEALCTQLVAELARFKYPVRVLQTPVTDDPSAITLILPAQIEDTVQRLKKNEPLPPESQVQLIFDPGLDRSLRVVAQAHLMLSLQGVLIERLAQELKNMDASDLTPVAGLSHFEGLVVETARGGFILPNPIQQTVPAWALFGMFFIVIPISNSMIRDRRLGIFKRLLSFPVNRRQLLIGKILPFLLINVIQFAMMFAVGVFLLPRLTNLNLTIDFSLWSILAVTVAAAAAATAYGLLVSCVARTSEQASAFGALSIVILAIAGGVMIPRFVMPGFMQAVAKASPLYWGLEAYHDVIVRHTPWTQVLMKIEVLLVFALVCAVLAVLRFRWNEVE